MSPPEPVASGAQPPVSLDPASPAAPAAPSTPPDTVNGFVNRGHLVLGGGYHLETHIAPTDDTYRRVAPGFSGGMILVQPSGSVVRTPRFDFRLGADYRHRILSASRPTPAADGSTTYSVQGISIAGLAEVGWNPHTHFGLGANLALGYLGFTGSQIDVGAPVPYNFEFGSDGAFFLGLQGFLTFGNQAFRAVFSLDMTPGGFNMSGASRPVPANADLPMMSVLFAVDPVRFFAPGW